MKCLECWIQLKQLFINASVELTQEPFYWRSSTVFLEVIELGCTYLYNGSSSFGMVLIYMLSRKNRFHSSCFCTLTLANSEDGKQKQKTENAVLCYRMGPNMFIERVMSSQDLDFRLNSPQQSIATTTHDVILASRNYAALCCMQAG